MKKFENTTYTDKEKYLQQRRLQKQRESKRLRAHMDTLLKECLFCGSIEGLVFHHVNANEKLKEVTTCSSRKKINEEASKCWCLCKGCHNKLHQRLCDPLPSAWDTRISVPETPQRG